MYTIYTKCLKYINLFLTLIMQLMIMRNLNKYGNYFIMSNKLLIFNFIVNKDISLCIKC